MTAAVESITDNFKDGIIGSFPMQASTDALLGTLIVIGNQDQGAGIAGHAKELVGTDELTHTFVGVAADDSLNAAGVAAEKDVKVRISQVVVLMKTTGATEGDQGKNFYAVDNQTGSKTPVSGSFNIGVITDVVSGTEVFVRTTPLTSGGVGVSRVTPSAEYDAASVDKRLFTADRSWRVRDVNLTVTVAGTDGSPVTATIRRVPSGTAITAGVDVLSASFDLRGTADTVQVGALTAVGADLLLADGDSLAIDFTGVLTAATGVVTVGLEELP